METPLSFAYRWLVPLLLIGATALAQEEPKVAPQPAVSVAPAAAAALRLDGKLLDPAWFGGNPIWGKERDVDFFWQKPGLDLGGKTLHMMPLEDPPMLEPGRDDKDRTKAEALSPALRGRLFSLIPEKTGGRIKTSRSEGDVLVQGRVVDCRFISQNARFWAGILATSSTATWDLKLTDAKTGELLMAVHHRTTSSTHISSLDSRLETWCGQFATLLAERFIK